MKRRFGLLFLALWLVACASPFENRPAGVVPTGIPAPAPTSLTPEPAPSATAQATPAAIPQPSVQADAQAPTAAAPTAPAPTGALDDPARIGAIRPAPRDQIALAEAFRHVGDIPDVARTTPLDVKLGDVETFWVVDFSTDTHYQVSASLRYIGPVVLMYVDTALEADQDAIERSAREFEQQIYPRTRALFGEERSPGVDGDPRLTIVNTAINGGAAGYFSGADGVPKAVNRFSNERDMFVMGVNNPNFTFGSPSYSLTLAHEFQHMIEANAAPNSASWFNEGMSTLSQDLNGYVTQSYAAAYLPDPDLQLTDWSVLAAAHYGASQLFLRYFHEQYAGDGRLRELIGADAGNNLGAFVAMAARKHPDVKSFADLYADWAVANIVNDPAVGDGRYAYQLLPERPALTEPQASETTTVSQFGVDYYGELQGPMTFSFDGGDTVGLTGTTPREGRFAWWSNRADDSAATLTRAFDLRGVTQATLQFATWYEIELNYDYAFVGVSTDGGKTWTTLKGNTTTDDDPQGQNFGNGLTGISGSPGVESDQGTRGQWIKEQMDLTPFAGQQILLRFWLIQDTAVNEPGMLVDEIRIPELGYRDGGEDGDAGWLATGFARTTGELPQTWALRLVRSNGSGTTVEPVPVDAEGRASVQLGDGERGTLAVIGTTSLTTEPAAYTYSAVAP
jgi:immune inhibitor A